MIIPDYVISPNCSYIALRQRDTYTESTSVYHVNMRVMHVCMLPVTGCVAAFFDQLWQVVWIGLQVSYVVVCCR